MHAVTTQVNEVEINLKNKQASYRTARQLLIIGKIGLPKVEHPS